MRENSFLIKLQAEAAYDVTKKNDLPFSNFQL